MKSFYSSKEFHLFFWYRSTYWNITQWWRDPFMCNTDHIRSYNVKSHWKVQEVNSTPELHHWTDLPLLQTGTRHCAPPRHGRSARSYYRFSLSGMGGSVRILLSINPVKLTQNLWWEFKRFNQKFSCNTISVIIKVLGTGDLLEVTIASLFQIREGRSWYFWV